MTPLLLQSQQLTDAVHQAESLNPAHVAALASSGGLASSGSQAASGGQIAGISTEALIAGGAVVVGLVLWISGGRLLRPAITLTGTLTGALFGSALAAGLQLPDFHGVPAGYAGIALGGLLGLGLALMLYRVAIAGVAGIGLGAAAATTAALCLGIGAATLNSSPAHDSHTTPDSISNDSAPLAQVRENLSSLSLDDLEQVRQQLAGNVQERSMPGATLVPAAIRSAGSQIQDTASQRWSSLGAEPRMAMTSAAIVGGMIGAFLGLLSPQRAGALVTGLAGAALWLIGGVVLTERYAPELADRQWVSWTLAHPPAWALIWILMGLVGTVAQAGERKQKKQPAPVAQPAKA